MRTRGRYGRPVTIGRADRDAALRRCHRQVADAADDVHAFALQEAADRRGNLRVLARQQPRRALQHADLGAEAAEHLREFQPDIAAAEYDEMLRDDVQRERGSVGEVRHAFDAGDCRHRRPATDIDEHALRGKPFAADLDLVRRNETSMAAIHGAVLRRPQRRLGRGTPRRDDRILALLHLPHVHRHGAADHDAELGSAACHVRGVRAGDHGLGRRAAGVDAGPAERPALDDDDPLSGAGEPLGQRRTRLTGADDDRVMNWHCYPSCGRSPVLGPCRATGWPPMPSTSCHRCHGGVIDRPTGRPQKPRAVRRRRATVARNMDRKDNQCSPWP